MNTQKKRSALVKILFWLIVLGVIVVGVAWWYWNSLLAPVNPSDTKLRAFVVPRGQTLTEVTDNLEQQGLIKSAYAFRAYLKLNNVPLTAQAGDFKLSPAMSLQEIIQRLQSGSDDVWVTFLEGWRVEEMAEQLEKEMGISQKDFLKVAEEGYMFPDSYLFNKQASATTVASTLKNTFDSRYTDELKAKIRKQGLTPEEGVIVASLVEREARSDAIRQQVASIILKRYNMGMKLDIDATLQYILGYSQEEKTWWRHNIYNEHKEIKSPYNTYNNAELPPKPICNPSLSSLNAVANANANTPYLFYFHDSKGNTYYGKTLDEHNANVEKYR
jgi:UPF0755 protein